MEHLIRASSLMGFERLVKRLGGDPRELLSQQGLSMEQLYRVNAFIPVAATVSLMESSAAQLNCMDFGLLLAKKQGFSLLGPLGAMLERCQSVRQVLELVQKYISSHSNAEAWKYQSYADLVYLQRIEYFYGVDSAVQYKEHSLAVCYQLGRALLGSKFSLQRVNFSHSAVSSPAVYRQYFSTEVNFNHEDDELIFPSRLLDISFYSNSSGENNSNLDAALDNELSGTLEQDIGYQVMSLLQLSIGEQQPSIMQVANVMGLNKRTLQRKMEQHGIVFRELLQDIRIRTACWYLSSSNIDITLLAQMLGYADISGFSRAFKKSTGCSPRRWRNQQVQRVKEHH